MLILLQHLHSIKSGKRIPHSLPHLRVRFYSQAELLLALVTQCTQYRLAQYMSNP